MVNPYQALYGNPYQALYGYTAPLGAYQVMYGAHKRRKKRAVKKDARRAKKLRALLAARARQRRRARAKAKSRSRTMTPSGVSSRTMTPSGVSSRTMTPGGVDSRTMTPQGRHGIRTSAVRHHKYALRKKYAQRLRRLNPRRHRARLPGQRQFDGRRRQGPISAQEIQQAPVAADADMNDDGVLDVMPEMEMDTSGMDMMDPSGMDAMAIDPTTGLVPTEIPDIDFDLDDLDAMPSDLSESADMALSGIADFVDGFTGGRSGLTYGLLGAGLGAVVARFGASKKHTATLALVGALGGYFYGKDK